MTDNDSTDEFTRRRNERDGDKYRLLQGAAMLKLFNDRVGRPPRDTDELLLWFSLQQDTPSPIDPFEVLTDDEIRATLGE